MSVREEIMGNSYLSKVKMSEKERSNRCKTAGTAGASTLDSTPEQRLTCFRDILDLVLHMSDEEWKAVSRDMAKEVTRSEFAAASTRILMVALSVVFRYLMKPLSESLGMEAILEANDKLKSKSRKCSASDAALRSPTEASDFICHLAQRIVTDIKDAMLEAIQSTATGPRVSYSVRASPAEDPLSQLDEYSIACTNEICDNILALYLSEELHRPEGEKKEGTSEKSHQEVHGIMKGLEEAVSNNRSSAGFNLKSLISELVSKMTEVMGPKCASLVPRAEKPFSDQFMSKASQVVSDILLKTEQRIVTSGSPQNFVPVCGETELNFLMELVRHSVSLENIQESAAAKLFLDKNTQFTSDILMKRLSSYISTGLIKVKETGSSRTSSSMASVDLDQVACDIVNRVISGIALEIEVSDMKNRFEAWAGDAQGNELPHSRRYSISRKFRNLSGGRRFIDAERTPQPSARNGSFVPSNLFTAVRNHLKGFFTFLSKSAADNKRLDASSTAQDHIVPIYIGEDGSVYELSPEEMIRRRAHAITDAVANLILRNVPKAEDIGRSTSDTVLDRGNSMLQSIQFPTDLVYRFVEESTKALVQDVLNAGLSTETKAQDEPTRDPTALALAHKLQDSVRHSVCPNIRLTSTFPWVSAGPSRLSSQNQGNKTKLGFRFTVKRKKVVIRWPVKHFKKQKKRHRSPLPRRNYSTTSTIIKLHSSSHTKSPASRLVLKTARRILGRICEFTKG